MITIGSKEFYDAISYFENNVKKITYVPGTFEKEERENWKNGNVYKNGELNKIFHIFLWGTEHGYALRRDEE